MSVLALARAVGNSRSICFSVVAAFARCLHNEFRIKGCFRNHGKSPLLLRKMALRLRMVCKTTIIGMTAVVTALGTKVGVTKVGVTMSGVTMVGMSGGDRTTMPVGDQATLRQEITTRLTSLLHVNTISPQSRSRMRQTIPPQSRCRKRRGLPNKPILPVCCGDSLLRRTVQ